jgi:hypothetical protein
LRIWKIKFYSSAAFSNYHTNLDFKKIYIKFVINTTNRR